jgi:hypothetical protein
MVYAMDTLGYAKRLRDAGIPQQQAEAHAEAARDFVMAELVTRNDLQAVRSDLDAVKADLQAALRSAVQILEARIAAVDTKIDTQTLHLTVRMGALLAAGIAILAAIIKLG